MDWLNDGRVSIYEYLLIVRDADEIKNYLWFDSIIFNVTVLPNLPHHIRELKSYGMGMVRGDDLYTDAEMVQ